MVGLAGALMMYQVSASHGNRCLTYGLMGLGVLSFLNHRVNRYLEEALVRAYTKYSGSIPDPVRYEGASYSYLFILSLLCVFMVNDEEVRVMRVLAREGKSRNEIADYLGLTYPYVVSLLKQNNLSCVRAVRPNHRVVPPKRTSIPDRDRLSRRQVLSSLISLVNNLAFFRAHEDDGVFGEVVLSYVQNEYLSRRSQYASFDDFNCRYDDTVMLLRRYHDARNRGLVLSLKELSDGLSLRPDVVSRTLKGLGLSLLGHSFTRRVLSDSEKQKIDALANRGFSDADVAYYLDLPGRYVVRQRWHSKGYSCLSVLPRSYSLRQAEEVFEAVDARFLPSEIGPLCNIDKGRLDWYLKRRADLEPRIALLKGVVSS